MEKGNSIEMSELAALSLPDLMKALHTSSVGLTSSDAAALLKKFGPTRIEAVGRKTLLSACIQRFINPLVLILLFAAAARLE